MASLLLALFLQDVDRLIQDLSHDDPAVREAATLRLTAAGPQAVEALQRATGSRDPEVVARARDILREIRVAPFRARLSPKLVEQAPDIPDLLVSGKESDLLQVIKEVSGLTPETRNLMLSRPQVAIPMNQLREVYKILWEQMQSARRAGAPMSILEGLYPSALTSHNYRRFGSIGMAEMEAEGSKRVGRLFRVNAAPDAPGLSLYSLESLDGMLGEALPSGDSKEDARRPLADAISHGRRLLVQMAGTSGLPSAVPMLREMLRDPDADLAAKAATALAQLGDADSASRIAELMSDPSRSHRAHFDALVKLEAYDRMDDLVEAVDKSRSYDQPGLIVELLRLRPDNMNGHLERWLQSIEPPHSADLLATALIGAGRKDLAARLLDGVGRDPGYEGRWEGLVRVLCQAGVQAAGESLAKALEEGNPELVDFAAQCRAVESGPVLVRLSTHPSDRMAMEALESLCTVPGDLFERELPRWLASERVIVRRTAVWGAAQRGTPVPLEIVLPLLKEENGRYAAMVALTTLFPEQARETLEQLWKEPSTRYTAAAWMGDIDPARATEWMRTLVEMERGMDDEGSWLSAAVWLTERGDAKAREALEAAKVSEDYRFWVEAELADIRATFDVRSNYRRMFSDVRTDYRYMFSDDAVPFELNAAAFPEV